MFKVRVVAGYRSHSRRILIDSTFKKIISTLKVKTVEFDKRKLLFKNKKTGESKIEYTCFLNYYNVEIENHIRKEFLKNNIDIIIEDSKVEGNFNQKEEFEQNESSIDESDKKSKLGSCKTSFFIKMKKNNEIQNLSFLYLKKIFESKSSFFDLKILDLSITKNISEEVYFTLLIKGSKPSQIAFYNYLDSIFEVKNDILSNITEKNIIDAIKKLNNELIFVKSKKTLIL